MAAAGSYLFRGEINDQVALSWNDTVVTGYVRLQPAGSGKMEGDLPAEAGADGSNGWCYWWYRAVFIPGGWVVHHSTKR